MWLMYYLSMRGEDLTNYAKKASCKLLHAYIGSHRKSLIYKYPGNGAHAITILQCQCSNMTIFDTSR